VRASHAACAFASTERLHSQRGASCSARPAERPSSRLTLPRQGLKQRRGAAWTCAVQGSRSPVLAAAAAAAVEDDWRQRDPKDVRVLVVGSTGYIGKFVTRELIKRGYQTVALAREQSGIKGKSSPEDTRKELEGAEVRFGDVNNVRSLADTAFNDPVDVVVSCLASRTGGKKDSWDIDYQATMNTLEAGRAAGAKHYVLLSAICVQKPLLEFQKAKLKFEAALQKTEGMTYSIVRPTAFFKSIAGQVETLKSGKPYIMFGDGTLAACKPISESDLASFIADCVQGEDRINKVLPIGGPGKAYTAKEQAEMLFRIMGKEPKYFGVPVALMDFIIGLLETIGKLIPAVGESAEFGRIGKYYATESMLVWDEARGEYDADATPSYGSDTLEAFFTKAVKEGLAGQELGDAAVF